ncbi:MAG: tRNA preQ1(34) S-adenosylmethionine ribosyltransferase-isomerase QueA [Gammaproteobacteria bacterium]|nr:tRNA preQ1(34) S-adenosylmethionine ribosyltransferase-isomerase QueA [Gammaproteobacteria bacterium]
MQPADFTYALPEDLIAQQPLPVRGASRLLHLRRDGQVEDRQFIELGELLDSNDLLIFNDTRVMPARLFGHKQTGGKVELLLERRLEPTLALAQLKASRSPPTGSLLLFADGIEAEVLGRQDAFYVLRFSAPIDSVLDQHGHVPLPPYIRRDDAPADIERYQTVYARKPGAVAAPTAGLHFDEAHLDRLRDVGIRMGYVTLHVGAGTFQPLRDEQLRSGELHAESLDVSVDLCDQVAAARGAGGRVIAVGTTVMRALETAAEDGELKPWKGETRLFIRPGYRFRVADALLTNFHLPESSLLMLVCAFSGTDAVLAAYRHAVAQRYRFFSYGDAMFCHRQHA